MEALLTPCEALREAWRCLQCWDAPCTAACPAHVPIPEFIARLRTGDLVGAEALVRGANPLIGTCGEICPDEQYCTRACVLGTSGTPVHARRLHRYVTAHARAPWRAWSPWQPHRIAVVGAGPAGIACARELATLGYEVEVYEREEEVGGIPRYGLAIERFSAATLEQDLAAMRDAPIVWRTKHPVCSLRGLLDSYAAVFYAPGTGVDVLLGIPEEEHFVTSGMSFLKEWRRGAGRSLAGKEVVVIGGGNASLDVALTAVHAGASRVVVAYRRGPQEMPVWRRELLEAASRGVSVEYYARPVGLLAEGGALRGVQFCRTRLVDRGERRRVPEDMAGFDFVLPADEVIRAVGSVPTRDEDVDVRWGSKATMPVSEDLQSALPRLWAGGDIVSHEGTVVAAVSHGLRAARAIHRMLSEAYR